MCGNAERRNGMREDEINKVITSMAEMNGIELEMLYAFTRRVATVGTEQISQPPEEDQD